METEDDSESNGFDTRVMDTFQSSPWKDSPSKLNFEETTIHDVPANIYDTSANIDSGDQQTTYILENA